MKLQCKDDGVTGKCNQIGISFVNYCNLSSESHFWASQKARRGKSETKPIDPKSVDSRREVPDGETRRPKNTKRSQNGSKAREISLFPGLIIAHDSSAAVRAGRQMTENTVKKLEKGYVNEKGGGSLRYRLQSHCSEIGEIGGEIGDSCEQAGHEKRWPAPLSSQFLDTTRATGDFRGSVEVGVDTSGATYSLNPNILHAWRNRIEINVRDDHLRCKGFYVSVPLTVEVS